MTDYDPNANREDRFRALHGRDITEGERRFFDAREAGYTGWWDHQQGRPVSDAEHQADVEKKWAENEAQGLRYDSGRGWVQREDQEAGR